MTAEQYGCCINVGVASFAGKYGQRYALERLGSWLERLIHMSWIDNINDFTNALFKKKPDSSKHEIPEGVWTKCEACNQVLYRSELERNLNVCPKCGHHMRIKARARLDYFLDKDGREELGADLEPHDVLRFKDLKRYKERYTAAQKSTGEKDAIVVEKGTLMGIPVVACAFEFNFMAGSMGSVVGARFCLAVQECIKENRALVCFSTSGGARMQESLLSLMQMAKTSAALSRLAEHHLPFVSVMSNPTMGGVSASLAMLGDINIAEPHALIGFAGPRVIEQTVREKLPEGFQLSEFLLDKGAIDMIVPRHKLRTEIAELLAKMLDYNLDGETYVLSTNTLDVINFNGEPEQVTDSEPDAAPNNKRKRATKAKASDEAKANDEAKASDSSKAAEQDEANTEAANADKDSKSASAKASDDNSKKSPAKRNGNSHAASSSSGSSSKRRSSKE